MTCCNILEIQPRKENCHAAEGEAKLLFGPPGDCTWQRCDVGSGGANIAQQYLKVGLVDEMEIHVAPLLLGDGARLFDNTDGQQTDYECIRVVNSPTVSHYKYRRRQTRGTD